MRIIYLAPFEGSGRIGDARRAKHAGVGSDRRRYTGVRLSRQHTLGYLDGIDAELVADIENDSDCFVVSAAVESRQAFDAQIGAAKAVALGGWVEGHGVPGEFLTEIAATCTARQASWFIVSYAMFAQRLEVNGRKQSIREALVRDPKAIGQGDRAKVERIKDTLWQDVSVGLKDQLVHGWELWKHFPRIDYNAAFNDVPLRFMLRDLAFRADTVYLGGHSLDVPLTRQALRMLAYGDNRVETITESLDSATNWSNGPGLYTAFTVSGGEFHSSTTSTSIGATNDDTLNDDQWATGELGTLGSQAGGANAFIAAECRRQSATNEAGYRLTVSDFAAQYQLEESSDDFGSFDTLDSLTQSYTPADGDLVTVEAEGTTIRGGTSEGGGADTERVSASDGTLSGGLASLAMYLASTSGQFGFEAFSAGNIVVAPAVDQVSDRFYYDDGGHP